MAGAAGAAIAGGAGLVSVCDVVIAAREAQFGFSEVRLGLVPAIISPFVIGKIGASAARALFVTGGRIDADRAGVGLVIGRSRADALESAVNECVNEVLLAAPGAIDHVKSLLREIDGRTPDRAVDVTVEYVTARRLSDEGRAGVVLVSRRHGWRRRVSRDERCIMDDRCAGGTGHEGRGLALRFAKAGADVRIGFRVTRQGVEALPN